MELGNVTARDCYDGTPLHYAAMNLGRFDFEISEITLGSYKRPDFYEMNSLSGSHTIDIYELLVRRGADVNAIEMFGETLQQLRALFESFAQMVLHNVTLLRSF